MKNSIILAVLGGSIVTICFVLSLVFNIQFDNMVWISIIGFIIFSIGAVRMVKLLDDEFN